MPDAIPDAVDRHVIVGSLGALPQTISCPVLESVENFIQSSHWSPIFGPLTTAVVLAGGVTVTVTGGGTGAGVASAVVVAVTLGGIVRVLDELPALLD